MANKEETGVSSSFSSEEQDLGDAAHNAFLQAQYDFCITNLKKIQKNHPSDCKLMHNRAVAEFMKSGQTKPMDLKKALLKVTKVSQQSHQEDEDLSDEVILNDRSVTCYNLALLYYFLHQYTQSQSMLESMAEAPDPPHNILKILPLLVEVYLANNESEKANRILSKIEELSSKPVSVTQSKHGSGMEGKDKGKGQKVQTTELKTTHSLRKIRCCLQTKSIKSCKKELKSIVSVEPGSDPASNALRMVSIFLKSNFEYLRGNFYKAYKLLGCSPPTNFLNTFWLQNGDSVLTMFFNNLGVIHFQLSKYALGTFYFGKALEENDKAISTNISSSSSKKDNKYHQQSANNAKTIHAMNMNKKFELLYNTGVQLLFSGKPSAAFDCLITAVQVFYCNPRLWLRLAECCIQASCTGKSEGHTQSSPNRKSKYHNSLALYSIIGSGAHQKIVVHSPNQPWTGGGNSVMPGPTLEFASVCLQNALTILAEAGLSGIDIIESKKNHKNNPQSANNKSEISVRCHPTGSISGQALSNLHASILANSAFVALSLGNNLMAHECSKVLLQLPNISNHHMYLGKMYSAEALVSLDRISDAIQHLSSDVTTDVSDIRDSSGNKSASSSDDASTRPVQKPVGSSTQCCFKSIRHAQACMLFNRAVAHSLRSEFEKGQKLMNQFATLVPQQDVPPTAILLAVYINLHTHGLQSAIKILQHNSLPSHMSPTILSNLQMTFRPQQPSSAATSKPFANIATISPSGTSGSAGSVSGGSVGSRSKSSTPQPHHSNPPSGSVTPERVVKTQSSSKSESTGSKSKRNRR